MVPTRPTLASVAAWAAAVRPGRAVPDPADAGGRATGRPHGRTHLDTTVTIAVPIDVLLPAMLAGYAVGGATGALIISGLSRLTPTAREQAQAGRHRAR